MAKFGPLLQSAVDDLLKIVGDGRVLGLLFSRHDDVTPNRVLFARGNQGLEIILGVGDGVERSEAET